MSKRLSLLKWGQLIKNVIKFLKDKDVPKFKKLLLFIPIIYVISPIDLVSDFIPLLGWLDDAAILTFAWNFFLQELSDYDLNKDSTIEQDDSKENSGEEYTLNKDDYRID
ncbi:YkvA family protein [Selenihalanaerobacter shriftii]|uniref:DUF1232 domain-containing protein n=1 Tax=Selenihalanaerobacter shriftii TaxID=142842 RepID=A0A1T4K6U4_9FIRM|nr:DUF1232 domain-containing protein [Selenihalanaerobacter shriftii]SJZ38025.1 Protein of unknown function [Selenihalanaerobacter shriftii]